MGIFTETVGRLAFEWPSRKTSYGEHITRLTASGVTLQDKIDAVAPTPTNHSALSHIIGIERWSQRRLLVALGEPTTTESYDRYRPEKDSEWETLVAQFKTIRDDSITLAQRLEGDSVPISTKVAHNGYGEISLSAWLQYIRMHATIEGRRFK